MTSPAQRPFVFVATGTHGIVLPLIAVAAEMVRRGHVCHLLSNQPFQALTEELQIAFTAIAPAQFNDIANTEVTLGTYVFPSYPRVQRVFANYEASGKRPAAVINTDSSSASNAMCDLFDIARVRLWLYPSKLRSSLAPGWPLARQLQGHFPHTFTHHHLPQLHAGALAHPLLMNRLNRYRRQWGLMELVTSDDSPSVAAHLALFPSWFAAPAADWPRSVRLLGFPLPAPRSALDTGVLDFIREHGRPLVFTPGTGVAAGDEYFRAAAECCELLGLPGVFLSLHGAQRTPCVGRRILQLSYADLGALLPHARLIVHNGGIGTVARALEAGIPQVIRPVAHDQPDNGHRIQALGVGTVLEVGEFTGSALARCVADLLGSESAARKLEALRRDVNADSAINAAADILEREFGHGV